VLGCDVGGANISKIGHKPQGRFGEHLHELFLNQALMKRLYEHLINGSDKGAALQEAKLDLLREFGDQALPIYWVGFTLVGDCSTAMSK
jgi:hypothetical protein